MSYYLFLDDARKPSDVNWVPLPENVAWVVARSYEDFVMTLNKMGIPKFIAYDNDLCEAHYHAFFNLREHYVVEYKNFETKCGIHCVEYLLKLCKKQGIKHPDFITHTRNHYAAAFIDAMIKSFNDSLEFPTAKEEEVIATPIPSYAEHSPARISGFFGPYRFLSNFWPAAVELDGHEYPSTEVAYQCAKCVLQSDRDKFLTATSSTAKQIGKKVILRPDWDNVRDDIMLNLVKQKFTKHLKLQRQLLETGTRELIEANCWRDSYWGVAYKFNHTTKQYDKVGGKNRLGEILMQLRSII